VGAILSFWKVLQAKRVKGSRGLSEICSRFKHWKILFKKGIKTASPPLLVPLVALVFFWPLATSRNIQFFVWTLLQIVSARFINMK